MKLMEKIRAASKKAASARADLQAAVEEIRNEISSLREERELIIRTPANREETAANIKRSLDSVERQAKERFSIGAFRESDGRPDVNKAFTVGNGVSPPGSAFVALNGHEFVGGLCALGLRELIESAMLTHAIAAAPGEGISASERDAKIRKIDASIEEAELAEEALIRSAEEAGITVFRRDDARPEIYLREEV